MHKYQRNKGNYLVYSYIKKIWKKKRAINFWKKKKSIVNATTLQTTFQLAS